MLYDESKIIQTQFNFFHNYQKVLKMGLGPAISYRMNSARGEKADPATEKAAERSGYYGQGL